MHAHLLRGPQSGVSSAPQAVPRAALEGASGESGWTQLPEGPALEELLVRKEEEWRSLQARRAQLQGAALGEAQGRLRSLREDFLYNLQLLEERDQELERYEAAFAQARLQDQAREAEASELRIEVAKLRQALAHETRHSEELQEQQRQTLREHRWELERLHSDKDAEINRHREQCEQLRGKLERELEGLDGELALQKQALVVEFEAELQKREHASSLQANAMSHAILTQELKVKLLRKELEALKEAGAEAAQCLCRVEAANLDLERKVVRRDRELQDLAAMKDARIKDLEGELQTAQLTQAREEEALQRKHDELDRLARERDGVLASVKEVHAEQLRALEARVQELQIHCQSLETQLHQAEGSQADAARDHNAKVTRLREEALALRSGWDAQVAQLSQEAVSRDLQVHALLEENAKLRAQAAQLQQDIDGYKQQLAAAVGREQSLEREKVQLELDWRHRCEDAERDQYRRSEDLVQGLATAREQVSARLQEAEQRLCDKDEVLKAVTLERDQAVQALRTHGLLPERETQTRIEHRAEAAVGQDSAWCEVQQLRVQNASLRRAVAEMRKEMEALGDQLLPAAQRGKASDTSQPAPNAAADTAGTTTAGAAMPDYVLALEAEIQSLKHKFKTLEDQLGAALGPPQKPLPEADVLPSIGATEDPMGGTPPAQVAPTVLAIRKLSGRVRLLDSLVSRLQQKVLQEAVPVWLHREVAQVRVELSELGQQAAELEKHLSASQKEGGETARRTRPPTPETMTLRGQGPAGGEPKRASPQGQHHTPHSPKLRLGQQLRTAARRILRLQQRNEQLVETGNRLRAGLGRPPGEWYRLRVGGGGLPRRTERLIVW
ncbi:coiled-coil domain-containing protein 57 [Tenrec ecaudatus]|uniref:coiled-coil domain-containing protein 57 n=1 Tax=Tenrec ecaudatus TaxID=94439 RepID=UPI003F59B8B4